MPVQNKSKVPVGTILEGKFRVTREIGRGGMAAVYEAENVDIGKRVAVKILAAELITSRIVRERFLREARAAAAIRSPYICDVYDSGTFEERPFLVMELLEGETLYDRMVRERQMDVPTTLRIITHAARGLSKAHESNVVHRDLKPENILLTRDEEGKLQAKIVDFGLAKFYEPTTGDAETVRLTREGALFGTPAYMSPEQAKGKGEVDHRSDLWALACIVYECLTGHTVWNVEQGVAMILAQIASAPIPKPTRLRPDLPAAFDSWFVRALDRDPDKRFQNAREFLEKLTQAVRSERHPSLTASISSAEGGMVDELISGDDTRASERPTEAAPPPATPPGSPVPPAAGSSAASASASRPSTDAPAALSERDDGISGARRAGRAIAALLAGAALSLSGYAVWLYALNPPHSRDRARPVSSSPSPPAPSASQSSEPKPLEPEAYAKKLAEAQQLFAEGQKKPALEAFREAWRSGGAAVARSMLSRASFAVEEASGSCAVSALGHPRPFALETAVSRPALARTARGVVLAWIDNHQDARHRQAYAVLLDPALRRSTAEISITPEAISARQIELVPDAEGLALAYWEDGGNEPGVYVRLLDADAHIASPVRLISAVRKGELAPTLVTGEAGSYWVLWQEEIDKGAVDLLARPLDAKLEPLSEPLRLTALLPVKGAAAAGGLSAVVADGQLRVAFSVNRGADRFQVLLLSVALNDPALKTGLVTDPHAPPRPGKERFVGHLLGVSTRIGKNTTPALACSDEGCFVAWDDEKGGATVAFVERQKGQLLWHREFGPKSARPALANGPGAPVLSWYEDSRIHFTRVSRDGIGTPSILSRINGFQPQAAILPGESPGKWYLSWRDYESAHLEVFALRAECQ